jgi:hypothetical protein
MVAADIGAGGRDGLNRGARWIRPRDGWGWRGRGIKGGGTTFNDTT